MSKKLSIGDKVKIELSPDYHVAGTLTGFKEHYGMIRARISISKKEKLLVPIAFIKKE